MPWRTRIRNVEQFLIWRKTQPVRAVEVVDDGFQVATCGIETEHVIMVKLTPNLSAWQSVRRIGEPKSSVGRDNHIIRRVQFLPSELFDNGYQSAMPVFPRDPASTVFA